MEDMSNYPGLQRRNGMFYVRLKVPANVRHGIRKREVVRSLGTHDFKKAVSLYRREIAAVDALFERARQAGTGKIIPLAVAPATRHRRLPSAPDVERAFVDPVRCWAVMSHHPC
jgi:hypothetical protein